MYVCRVVYERIICEIRTLCAIALRVHESESTTTRGGAVQVRCAAISDQPIQMRVDSNRTNTPATLPHLDRMFTVSHLEDN